MQQTQDVLMNLDVVSDVQQTTVEIRDLNKELLVLRLSFGQLKAAIRDAAAPLMAVVVPALTAAVRWATRLVKTVGQVIAGVLGIQVAQTKLEKVVVSTGKALKRTVAGFDQLNRLQEKTGSGSTVQTAQVQVPTTLPPQVQKIVDAIKALLEPLKNVDLSPLRWEFERLKDALKALWSDAGTVLKELWHKILVPFLTWAIEKLAPVLVNTLAEGVRMAHAALLAFGDGFLAFWENAQPVVEFLGETVITALTELGDLFVRLREGINDDTIAIRGKMFEMGVDLRDMWESSGITLDKMRQGFHSAFETIGDHTIDTFNGLLDRVRSTVQGISSFFIGGWSSLWGESKKVTKSSVNSVVSYLNGMLGGFGSAINGVSGMMNKLRVTVPDWVPEYGGKTFGFQLKSITVPKIPYLAKGAVLPANRPFLAMVGDQKHGTNVEAPLSTIQQAVAVTMEDQLTALQAGFNATVAELQMLRSAVGQIQVGDTVIGQAAHRYQQRLATARGSVY